MSMIGFGSDDKETKQAELRASRMEWRVDRLEEKLGARHDEIDAIRRELRRREDQVRYLVRAVGRLEGHVARLTEKRQRLQAANLDLSFLPDYDPGHAGDRPDQRLKALDQALAQMGDAVERLAQEVNGDRLAEPTDALEVLATHLHSENVEEQATTEAPTLAEIYRLWMGSDAMDRYHKELLAPYVDAVTRALKERPGEATVHAAKAALPILKEAFAESRTYLLRRSSALDGHRVEVDVRPELIGQDPHVALDRFGTVLDQVRPLGAVDFFHNLHLAAAEAVREGEPGAGGAAWLLSDASVAILTDPGVKEWLQTGIT